MHQQVGQLLATASIIFCSFSAYAWNALGHQVITHIAYQQLNTAAKNKVDTLVADFNKDYPTINTLETLSVWPDAVRSQKINTYTHWHYIDMPLIENKLIPTTPIDTDNAVWALDKIKPVVENDKANRFERARFLAFFVHIVGDLHQPLHTASLFSLTHPDGDKGGNAYLVYYHNKTTNLHSLWDKGVGAFEGSFNPETVDTIVTSLIKKYPKNYFGARLDKLDTQTWLAEGMKYASEYVYDTLEGEPVSQQYVIMGKKIAEEQATLAGYRLGTMLNELLG